MNLRRTALLGLSIIFLLATILYIVSKYIQPSLQRSLNTDLVLAGMAIVGAATFLAALKDIIELIMMFERTRQDKSKQSEKVSFRTQATPNFNRGNNMTHNISGDNSKNKIFISYSKEDKGEAHQLYDTLKKLGLNPWLDEKDLLPGQDWELEIRESISASDYFLACLSSKSVGKRGYVNKEIKFGLDVLEQIPERQIYLIPVRLDECNIPIRLQSRQWVNLYEPDGLNKLLSSLNCKTE